MKRFKNLVIGGIQSKIFNLILYTVVLLTVAFMAVALYQSNMLANVVGESGQRQKTAISEITGGVMDQVVVQSLGRSNKTEARFADDMFSAAAERVAFMADCVGKVFSNPASYAVQPFAGPDPADDGVWTAKVIYANGADEQDEAIRTKLGLLANLTDPLVSLCASFGVEDVYIALPEGAFFTVDDISSSWFVEGKPRDYDPRERQWYRQAVQSGDMIFTDGEWDVNTGKYCVECAMPVYGADGELQAVVGLDLFLDEIQQVMQDSSVDGEFNLLVNQDGRAVLPMQAETFPMAEADRENDLRASSNPFLAQIVRSALEGEEASVTQGELSDGAYYVTATPIGTTGWVLLSAFDQSISDQPAQLLEQSLAQVQTEATAVYQEKSAKSRTTAIVLLIIVMLLTLTGALVLGGRIVKPLNTITRRISELSEGNLEFRMEDAYRTGDEVEELAQSFATISHKTVVYMDKVVKVTAEKERIGAELSLATQIQASMLPHIFPAFPERGEFDIYASMDPAKEVGGDFYDFFLVGDDCTPESGKLAFVVADVSGKGVPAALFMGKCKVLLDFYAMLGLPPAEIFRIVNEKLCAGNESELFVTCWLGIFTFSTGTLRFVNAGHPYPVLYHGGAFAFIKEKPNFVLGGMEGLKYKEHSVTLSKGDRLFIYTDGVTEATDSNEELFGDERLLSAMNDTKDLSAPDTLKKIRADIDDFVGSAEQFDDITMLQFVWKNT